MPQKHVSYDRAPPRKPDSLEVRAIRSASVRNLAEAAGLHRNTITNIEVGHFTGDPETLMRIEKVLTAAGVEFIVENGGGPGVRLQRLQRAGAASKQATQLANTTHRPRASAISEDA